MENNHPKKLLAIAVISAIAISVASGSFFALGVNNPLTNGIAKQAYSQESAELSSDSGAPPTIKVTGDASTTLTPDQATIIINVQTQPGDLDSVIDEQSRRTEQVIQTVRNAAGDDANISIGYQNLSPFYSGSGVQASNNVTFNVYASVRINTNIDQLPTLVNSLAEEGFGFESVYIDPVYSASVLREAGIVQQQETPQEGNESAIAENPIAIAVTINTQPDVLTKAIAEYEGKYRKLLEVLNEVGVSAAQVQQNSFNIYPLFYGPSQSSGYNANTQIVVKTDTKNIDATTKALQGVSNTYVESVFISVSDAAIDKARAELSQQAISNARTNAEEMTGSLGLEIKGIKSIEAGSGQTPNPYGGEIVYRGVKVLQPYSYQNVAGTISVSVTVEFELAAKS
jgi:uncharacterized protein YggE